MAFNRLELFVGCSLGRSAADEGAVGAVAAGAGCGGRALRRGEGACRGFGAGACEGAGAPDSTNLRISSLVDSSARRCRAPGWGRDVLRRFARPTGDTKFFPSAVGVAGALCGLGRRRRRGAGAARREETDRAWGWALGRRSRGSLPPPESRRRGGPWAPRPARRRPRAVPPLCPLDGLASHEDLRRGQCGARTRCDLSVEI